jgi:hypothetical protein
LKRASLATALFVAGAVAGDFAVRGTNGTSAPAASSAPVEVIHKRKVRTVHLHPKTAAPAAVTPAAGAAPSAVATATPVSSRTSPGAAAGGEGGEGGEVERGD